MTPNRFLKTGTFAFPGTLAAHGSGQGQADGQTARQPRGGLLARPAPVSVVCGSCLRNASQYRSRRNERLVRGKHQVSAGWPATPSSLQPPLPLCRPGCREARRPPASPWPACRGSCRHRPLRPRCGSGDEQRQHLSRPGPRGAAPHSTEPRWRGRARLLAATAAPQPRPSPPARERAARRACAPRGGRRRRRRDAAAG